MLYYYSLWLLTVIEGYVFYGIILLANELWRIVRDVSVSFMVSGSLIKDKLFADREPSTLGIFLLGEVAITLLHGRVLTFYWQVKVARWCDRFSKFAVNHMRARHDQLTGMR